MRHVKSKSRRKMSPATVVSNASLLKGDAINHNVCLLLMHGATELDYVMHAELFRITNSLLNGNSFCVETLSVDDHPVTLANGRIVHPSARCDQFPSISLLIVLSHINQDADRLPAIHKVLRKVTKHAGTVAAADHGPLLLASAGLLDRRTATCHIDLMLAAQESYPSVHFVDQLRVRDGNIVTYAGHFSTVDVILEYVQGVLGEEFAHALAQEVISAPIRISQQRQCRVQELPSMIVDRRIRRAVEIMRENIEAPLAIPEIAERVGVSTRSLEAIWRMELGTSPQFYYMRERINHSCSLMLFSTLSITEISYACGFNSGTSFSRAFSDVAGVSPSDYRKNIAIK